MKYTNITKTIVVAATLAFMQIAAFAQKAELVVQTGHNLIVNSVAFSPDGKIIATAATDTTVKIWDAASGKELKTLAGHTDWVNSIAFSPDGKMLVSGGQEGVIKLWDMTSGKELKTLNVESANGQTPYVYSVAFSPDGKIFASGHADSRIRLWDAASGREVKTLIPDNTSSVESVAFSPDGKTLASLQTETTLYDKNLVKVGGGEKTVKLWDAAAGKELKTLFTGNVYSIAFSADGKTLASGHTDAAIKLWDVASGKEVKTLSGHKDLVRSIAFSPDGKTFASGSDDNTVKLWDAASGRELKTLSGHKFLITAVAFSPDGKTLASGSDVISKLWEVASGREINTLSGHTSFVWAAAFSPDGKKIASGYFDGTIVIWDAVSGEQMKTLSGHTGFINAVAFSPDGKTFASASPADGSVKLWDTDSGQVLKTVFVKSEIPKRNFVGSMAFSPDGKTLVLGIFDGTIRIWDAVSGRELKTFSGHTDAVNVVAYSTDGKTVASASDDNTIKLWNVSSGQTIKSFNTNEPEAVREVSAVVPDFSKQEASRTIFGGTTYNPTSPDGRFKIRKGTTGNVDLFDAKSDKLLASLFMLDKTEWVVIDPQGRFDASTEAQKLMHFAVGLEPVDLSQIKDRYFTPNLLQRIFKGENLDQTRKVSVFTADELYPLVEYEPLKDGQTILKVKLKNRGGGIGRVQIFVNGSEFLADARPAGFNPKSQTGEFTVDFSSATTLKKGEANEISVVARNEAGWLKSRSGTRTFNDTRKRDETAPEFYAIVGGVSEYENSEFNLKYSAKDARDFAKALELGAVKLFGKDKVHIRLLASGEVKADLTGADSTQMLPSRENFKKTFEEFRKAKTTDVFVVYLAGHGVSINKGGDTGDTYLFMTKEATAMDTSRLLDEKLRSATTLSSEELAEWIKNIPALKRAMILDTCAAGAIETSLTKTRDLSPDQIKALDRMKDRTGFYVLMGSAADAQSYEATRYGQGLLTYSLLQGMSGARLRDGQYADINSLFNYAEDTVTAMAKSIGGVQQPRIISPNQSSSFDIGQFTTAETSKFTLAKVKPLILQPQFSNDKLKFDNLKISQSVAKTLRDESLTISRGGEAKIVFVEADEMNDAIMPGGVYEVVGDQIKVTLILVRNGEPVKTVTVEGSVTDKEELSKKIVKAIVDNASV